MQVFTLVVRCQQAASLSIEFYPCRQHGSEKAIHPSPAGLVQTRSESLECVKRRTQELHRPVDLAQIVCSEMPGMAQGDKDMLAYFTRVVQAGVVNPTSQVGPLGHDDL